MMVCASGTFLFRVDAVELRQMHEVYCLHCDRVFQQPLNLSDIATFSTFKGNACRVSTYRNCTLTSGYVNVLLFMKYNVTFSRAVLCS